MAPIITTNTVRYKLQYRAFGLAHTINMRLPRGTNVATAVTTVNVCFTTIITAFPATQVSDDFQWLAGLMASEDEDFFFNVSSVPTQPSGTLVAADQGKKTRSTYTKFSGRGGARNHSFQLYGVAWQQDDLADLAEDGLVTGLENSDIADCVTALNAAQFVAINNIDCVYNNYANIKQNDYWRDELKGT